MASSNFSTVAEYPSISIKLSKSNYPLWKEQMLGLIESQGLIGFIDGNCSAPDEKVPSTTGKKKVANQAYKEWKTSDDGLKKWIFDTLSEEVLKSVVDSKTARDVWTKLEITFSPDEVDNPHPYPYPYPSTLNVANFVSIKLSKTNYRFWKAQMFCLVESQDLVGFIDGTCQEPDKTLRASTGGEKVVNKDYLLWKRSDRLLKGWILGSLSEDVLENVLTLKTAAKVWTKLENTLAPKKLRREECPKKVSPQQESPKENPERATDRAKDLSFYLPLYKAALRGDWNAAENFFKDNINAKITDHIRPSSQTALHVAVGTRKAIHFVEKLVENMSPEAVAQQDVKGNTALNLAAIVGNKEAVDILIGKNSDLLFIGNVYGNLPHHGAAFHAQRETVSRLISATSYDQELKHFAGQSGVSLLVKLIVSGFFDMALQLVKRHPVLATVKPEMGDSPLTAIARNASAFPSGSGLNLWERKIYSCVPIRLNKDSKDQNGGDIENLAKKSQAQGVRSGGGNYFSCVPCVKHIQQKKLDHHQALELVKYLCKKIESSNQQRSFASHYNEALFVATRIGIPEVVKEIVDTFPSAIWSMDNNQHYLFHLAVINRSEKVFNLMHQMNEHKYIFTSTTDNFQNNILHLAGILAPPQKLNLVSGAALQMQRELQWFKEVEKFVNPAFKEEMNLHEETPALVFTKQHRNLVIEGEKWMKDTANSCTIAAALISTVVFAAAITVPGGNNGDSGLPIFRKNFAFIIFAFSDAISLFTSTTSLLMFLAILTSRYAEEDFLYTLPRRLIIGLFTLFVSTTFMMIAFSATLYLVFGEGKAWIVIPLAVLACLPITSLVSLQVPLLKAVFSSTYCGIFGKQDDSQFY